jgi:lipid II:glycine glycyltransferase (peptidoglycan interpeptide bridge formation enzyme)
MSKKGNEGNEWNERVRERDGSFLQSAEWADFQENRGRMVSRLVTGSFVGLAVRYPLPGGLSYVYLPHGPILTSYGAAPFEALTHAVRTEAAGALFVRVEPTGHDIETLARMLTAAGFIRTTDAQPSETRHIDLTRTEEELLADMEHDTRYAIRAAEKRGVRVRVITDRSERIREFAKFWTIFSETARRHELVNYPESYYRDVVALEGECPATLFLADHEGTCIGGAISVTFGMKATYFYAASASGYGRLNAPSAILWEVIREAKRRGVRVLDLWGESDSKPAWKGITAFKRSFGGTSVRTVGTWDLPLRPFWYRVYGFATRFRRH